MVGGRFFEAVLSSNERGSDHRSSNEGFVELPHGLLVPALDELFSHLDEPRFKKRQGSETLKTADTSCPQTTHFHRNSRIRRHRPKNCSTNPIPPSDGDIRLPHQGVVDLHGREPRRSQHRDRGEFPSHLNTHFHQVRRIGRKRTRNSSNELIPPAEEDYRLPIRSGQDILGTRDPCDIYGCYPEFFCTSTMTGDDEDATKVETTLPRTRSRSRSATKSRLKPGPSILEVLNCKKDKEGDKPVVKGIETFASIASRPPSPKATRLTVTEAAIAAATDELAVVISKHSADFHALLTSSTVKRTPA